MAFYSDLPIILILVAIPLYLAMFTGVPVFTVTVLCLLAAVVVMVFIFWMSGRMSETTLGRLLSGMFNKAFSYFSAIGKKGAYRVSGVVARNAALILPDPAQHTQRLPATAQLSD